MGLQSETESNSGPVAQVPNWQEMQMHFVIQLIEKKKPL